MGSRLTWRDWFPFCSGLAVGLASWANLRTIACVLMAGSLVIAAYGGWTSVKR